MSYRATRRRGLGDLAADQTAAWNAIVCPSGFNKPAFNLGTTVPVSEITADNVCLNQWGYTATAMKDPQIAALVASHTTQQYESYGLMAGGAALFILGDDLVVKLAGVGLAFFGFVRGAFIGGA